MANHENGVLLKFTDDHSHFNETLSTVREWRKLGNKFVVDGNHLTIAQVHKLAQSENSEVVVKDECLQEVQKNAAYLENKLSSGLVVYGINTGFGGSADVRCPDTVLVQESLVRHLNAGFGEVFDSSVPRGVMLIRVNSLSRAMSGVRTELIQLLCDMIKADIIPIVPKRGSVSASGDLMPSSYIAAAMMGRPDCKVLHNGTLTTAKEALESVNLNPITFINKEALAVLNSSSFAVSLGSQLLYAANVAAVLTQVAVGMSVEALSGRTESFHPTIHKCMPHNYQIEVADNILNLLDDSKLAITKLDMERVDHDGTLKQDRYALRTAAQWLGPAIEQLKRATDTVNVDLNSTNDNPVIDHHGDSILHGGNFQGTAMAVAMDNSRQALQLCGKLLFAQMSEIVNVNLNNGLPPNLSGCDYSKDFGFKGTETAMASYMSELDMLTSPVTRHVLSAEMNNQSVNSLALLSARWTEQALTVLRQMLANISVCQAQAIDLRWMQREVTGVLRTCCQKCGVEFNKLPQQIWRWYDFAFDSSNTWSRFTEAVPQLQIQPAAVDQATTDIETLVSKSKAGNHVTRVAESIGLGTRHMYLYIRKDLDIQFYHGERCLDTDLQKMYSAIVDGDVEVPLLNIVKHLF